MLCFFPLPCHLISQGFQLGSWGISVSRVCYIPRGINLWDLNSNPGGSTWIVRICVQHLCLDFYQQKPTIFGRNFMYIWKIQVWRSTGWGTAYFQTFLPNSQFWEFRLSYSHIIALQQKPNNNIFGKPRNVAAGVKFEDISPMTKLNIRPFPIPSMGLVYLPVPTWMVDLYGKGVGRYTSPIHGMGFGEPQLATARPTIAWSPGQLDSCSHVTAGNPRHTHHAWWLQREPMFW